MSFIQFRERDRGRAFIRETDIELVAKTHHDRCFIIASNPDDAVGSSYTLESADPAETVLESLRVPVISYIPGEGSNQASLTHAGCPKVIAKGWVPTRTIYSVIENTETGGALIRQYRGRGMYVQHRATDVVRWIEQAEALDWE
jgi:hypothetical protein